MGTNMCCLKITNKNKSTSVPSENNANDELIYSFPNACTYMYACVCFAVNLNKKLAKCKCKLVAETIANKVSK